MYLKKRIRASHGFHIQLADVDVAADHGVEVSSVVIWGEVFVPFTMMMMG